MDTLKIAQLIIDSEHGWSVAEQFENTFNMVEFFEEQNTNALDCILLTLTKLSNSDLLKTQAQQQLDGYIERLTHYLRNNCK